MDRETERQHSKRPHPSNGVSAHTTRLAASKKTHTTFSEEILGLQRWTINRRWNAPERTEVNHTSGTSRGVSKPSSRRPSLSKQGTGECKATYWTEIDADIEDYTKRCQECIKRSQVAKEPLQPHDIPEGPWRKLGITYFTFDGNSYVLICDYFSKFSFFYRAKTSFRSLRDRLIDLFSIEGYPDEIVSDNRPLFQSKEFAKFLSGLGIKHTTSSPGCPRSNGFIEWHIQTVKNMLSKSSNTWSFQEVLADLRTTCIGTGLPSPAEILHGRNLTTRVQAEIDIKAIRSVLQERQLKMTLDHDTSRRARKARPLVVGERCQLLGPGNKWIDAFITGITDSGRSYETQVEATGGQLTRNRSHIRPRSPNIPHIHTSFLQRNSVPSATSDGNTLSERENLVISGCQQLANDQKMVLSANCKGSIKQTNTSQILVSETVPDRRVQPSRWAKMTRFGDNPVSSTVSIPPRRQPGHDTSTRNRREFKLNVTDPDLLIPIKQTRVTTRHSDLREPQPSSSDSHPASSQSVTETTTSESSVSLPPVPHLEAQVQRAPVPVVLIVLCLRHHLRAAHSHLRMLQAQRQAVQPVHYGLHRQNCLRWSTLSTPCSQVPEIGKAIPWWRVNGQLERPAAAYRHTEASCQPATEPTKACLSASSYKHATSPILPKTFKWQGV